MTREWFGYIALAIVSWAAGYAYGDSHGWRTAYQYWQNYYGGINDR